MFCVVYQWKVKPGMEEVFRQTWRDITEAIFLQHSSLGSRLHQAQDGTFIAYAQWTDQESWEKHDDTIGVEFARKEQAQCLEDGPIVLFQLNVSDDLLKFEPSTATEDAQGQRGTI